MSCCSGVSFFRNKNNKSILQFYRKGSKLLLFAESDSILELSLVEL